MARLHSTTLLVLLLGSALYTSTSAYRPSLRTRMLQDGASATTAMNNTSASGNSTTGSGELPACRESFPPGPPAPKASGPRAGTPPPPGPGPAGASPPPGGPGVGHAISDSSSIFEHSKDQPFFKHRVATLASCLIEEGKCAEAVHKVDALSRALATATQHLYDKAAHNSTSRNTTSAGAGNGTASSSSGSGDASGASSSSTSSPAKQQPTTTPSPITGPSADSGSDMGSNSSTSSASAGGSNSSSKVEPAFFAQLLANSTEVKVVLKEKATCLSSQPGGEEAFMKGYADFVKELLSNSTGNSTSSSMGSGSMAGNNSTADNSTSATSPGATRTIGGNGRRPRFA